MKRTAQPTGRNRLGPLRVVRPATAQTCVARCQCIGGHRCRRAKPALPLDAYCSSGVGTAVEASADCACLHRNDRWPDGTVLRTFTIVTTSANAEMTGLHNRMPVILEAPDWPTWLCETPGDPAVLLRPAADGVLRAWPVSTRVNTPRNNPPDLLDDLEPSFATGCGFPKGSDPPVTPWNRAIWIPSPEQDYRLFFTGAEMEKRGFC
jgi:hypothetical protein